MKKYILIAMAAVMMLALCGCISTNKGEVDPNEVKMSIEDIDKDEFFVPLGIDSIDVLNDGEVILHANGDLLARIKENYVAAMGVSEAFVLPYGNGGYRAVIFLMEDGTVSALSPETMIKRHGAQLKTNLGKLEKIKAIEQGDDMLLYAVDSKGEKHMLDEYLDF